MLFYLYLVVRKGLSDALFEQNLMEVREQAVWTSAKGISSRGTSTYIGCVIEPCSLCLRNSKEAIVAGGGVQQERYLMVISYTWMRKPCHSLCLASRMASWRRCHLSSFMTTK